MAQNSIQELQKLLVDVPVGKGDEFMNTYGPGVPDRQTTFDDKVVFIHDSHTIFTQGDTFGGKETTVGNNNSFVIGGTTYTLTINNGELNINPYLPSSFNYTYFNVGSGSATANQSCEYGTSYNDVTVKATPSNIITYSINHGTSKILLVAIEGKNENSYTYLYGNTYTMTDGMITKIGSTTITEADYKNANITGALTIPNGSSARANEATVSEISGTATSTFTKTATTTTQTGVVYYHELGKTCVYKRGFIANTPTTKSSTVTVYKGYFVWAAATYSKPTTTTGNVQQPGSITTHQGAESEGKYAWFATTAAPTYEGSTYKKPVFNDGKYDGGWEPYKENDVVKTFTHYGDTYYVYKTKNFGLGDVTWRITY